ncbi:MAG: hypothetical protein ACOYXC_21780 [Candidatus Rifleibacteriota bacterium]
MNSCCLNSESLERKLNDFIASGKIPPEMFIHCQTCEACRLIFSSPEKARLYQKFKKTIFPERVIDSTVALSYGQIWQIEHKDNEVCLALIIDKENIDENKTGILIIRANPNLKQLESNEIILSGSCSPDGIPLLIETWNKRFIAKDQLLYFIGKLSDEVLGRIEKHVPSKVCKNSAAIAFRNHEIESCPGVPEKEIQSLKILYKCSESEDHMVIVKNFSTSIKLAAETENHFSLNDLYEKICLFIDKKRLKIRARYDFKETLKIIGLKEEEIQISFYFSDGFEKKIPSKNGVIEINAIDFKEREFDQLKKIEICNINK